MDVVRVVRIVGLMVSPTVAIGAAIYLPRLVRAKVRAYQAGRERPSGPPIEQVAADLRRLLQRYQVLRRSPQVAMRAHHLWALEAAIADCAVTAAEALDVAHPPRRTHGRLPTPVLHHLLQDLTGAGLVIPSAVDWLTPDA